MAKSKSNTTTTFEKVGDNIVSHALNLSGAPSPYTTRTPIKRGGKSVQVSGTKSNRSATMIHEANGPACKIVATLYKKNAAAASDVTRSIRILPSAVGDRDFKPHDYNKASGY